VQRGQFARLESGTRCNLSKVTPVVANGDDVAARSGAASPDGGCIDDRVDARGRTRRVERHHRVPLGHDGIDDPAHGSKPCQERSRVDPIRKRHAERGVSERFDAM
jgi:hypothetical protein